MSVGIQIQSSLINSAEISFTTAENGEGYTQEAIDSSLPDAPGGLQTHSSQHFVTRRSHTSLAKKTSEYFQHKGQNSLGKSLCCEKPSPMQLASKTPSRPFFPLKSESKQETFSPMQKTVAGKDETATPTSRTFSQSSATQKKSTSLSTFSKSVGNTPPTTAKAVQQQERSERPREKKLTSPLLASRQWSREETYKWWETRYHQREKQRDQKGQDGQEQHSEQEEKKLKISKTANISSKNGPILYTPSETGSSKIKKPELDPPKVGVFALYYLLTKMGILSDGTSNFACKKEIELLDLETTETHKKRLDDVKEAINKEKHRVRWGIAVQVASWIGSCVGILSGIMLVASGVGILAGAMLIAGSTIQLASQIMEISGGWQKIAEMLPGDDVEKKRAVVNWMQIAIGVICLIISGFGIIWGGGFTKFNETMNIAMNMIGGFGTIAQGVTTIGEGVSEFMLKDKYGNIKQFEVKLAQLKHMRRDLMEKMEWGVDRLEKLFEDLTLALDFEVELFQADQMINRR